MFQLISLFARPSSQSRDPEKTRSTLSSPHELVPFLITDIEQSYSPQQARKLLLVSVAVRMPEHYRQCLVTNIEWYKHKENAHELLLVHFERTTSHGVDKRVVRIERCKITPPKDGLASAQDSRDSLGLNNGNADRIRISETVTQAAYKYALVASFKVPLAASLSVASCIVAAGTVTNYATNYSTLAYMCMWYAAVLFNVFRRLGDVPESEVVVEKSAVAKRAGTFAGVRLVHVEGGFLDKIGSIEPIVKMMAKEMQRDAEVLRKEIEQDCAIFQPSTITALLQLSRQDIARFWADVKAREDAIKAQNLEACIQELALRSSGHGEPSATGPLAVH